MAESVLRQEKGAARGRDLFKEIEAVRTRFLDTMETTVLEFDALLGGIESPDFREKALEGIRFRAHKISGTAATLGYPRIGDLARQVETAIDERTASSESREPGMISRLVETLLEEMEQALDERMFGA